MTSVTGNHIAFSVPERIPVKLISLTGTVALVEYWRGATPQRVYVPGAAVVGDTVAEHELELGIQYGIDWEAALGRVQMVPPAEIARALRARGIWTPEDLYQNVDRARAVLLDILGMDVARIIAAVRAKERGGTSNER